MERNMSVLIDQETMDLEFDDEGIMIMILGDNTTAQCVRLTLLAQKGDFPLDTTHGTDLNRILGRKNNELEEDEADEVLRAGIFQETDVASVDSMTVDLDGRALGAEFTGTLFSGKTISMEVNI